MIDESRPAAQPDPAAEREAIQRLKRGDMAGLEALVRAHQTRALRVAYLIVGDVHTAEDLVADAFLSAHAAIARFDAARPFGPWLHRIVVNLALKHLRKHKRVVGQDVLEWQPDGAPGQHAIAASNEVRSRIWRAVRALPPEERTAVVLCYYLDHSEKEIAAAMNSPVGTVKWRLFSARKRLRAALAGDHAAAALQLE